ncbi:cellulosome protein dockerin type I [Sorangium cellulosum]|uniref:Cellulosome protein dockerin type I n=1 Tax=Sorangium cellulosum TaxID=56 RepID=A0A150SBL6_SORCE|nr:cellulosome protein dockerin type I [Sorangium cellulosum]
MRLGKSSIKLLMMGILGVCSAGCGESGEEGSEATTSSGSGATASSGPGGTTGTTGTGSAGVGGAGSGSTGAGGAVGTGGSGGGTGGSDGTGGGSNGGDEATIVPDPSWTCGMPGGIPLPTLGEPVFRATLELGETHDVGTTQFGDRRLLDVTGGTLTGDRVQATFLTGGMDLELTLSNGSVELEEINILRASDGTLIYMRSCGVAAAGDGVVRVVPDFEVAQSSSLAWLNTGKFAGTRVVDAAAGTIQLDIYDIADVAAGEPKVQLKDPEGVPNQSWECSTATGARGSSVFTESVTLGASISVGASKRGTRNIIPITGGTVTGGMLLSGLSGSVLPGGADYQLIGATTVLDARYALSSNDGEVIVVRNCGAFGALVPVFETRADGPYAILNTKQYVSSDPGGAAGGVSLTFYERR